MPGSSLLFGFAVLGAALAGSPWASISTRASSATVVVVADDSPKAPERAKDAGTLDGQVVAIDYRAGTMSVQAGSRRVDVVVLPSTNIQGPGNSFRTIADIHKGAHVRVLMSQRGETYTAQLINLR